MDRLRHMKYIWTGEKTMILMQARDIDVTCLVPVLKQSVSDVTNIMAESTGYRNLQEIHLPAQH